MARKPATLIILYRHSLTYAGVLALVLFLLRLAELRFIILEHAAGLYTLFIASVFVILGIWLALKLANPTTRTMQVSGDRPATAIPELSRREMEVLEALAKGWSNKEMAAALFVSENTIKTYLSNLFVKLEVNRRTQAIDKAQTMGIIPKNNGQTGEKSTPVAEITQKYE